MHNTINQYIKKIPQVAEKKKTLQIFGIDFVELRRRLVFRQRRLRAFRQIAEIHVGKQFLQKSPRRQSKVVRRHQMANVGVQTLGPKYLRRFLLQPTQKLKTREPNSSLK